MTDYYPLLFKHVYQDYPWGGDQIIRRFNRSAPPGIYAESWEVSDRAEGMSIVRNGPLAGQPLADVLAEWGTALLGPNVPVDRFPLLIKLLDARETLSVQVHPDDAGAAEHGGEAKTEMWYVLDAEPDAAVYAGFRVPLDPDTFRREVANGTLEPLLNRVPVKAGDAVFMPGGRIHAIGAGCLMLEVQQNSNTTYRLYDWGRVGNDGQPRPLHIEQAISVIDWSPVSDGVTLPRRLEQTGDNTLWEVLDTDWFRMERLDVAADWPTAYEGHSFHVLFAMDTPVTLHGAGQSLKLVPGTSCLIPAAVREYRLEPKGGKAQILRIMLPSK